MAKLLGKWAVLLIVVSAVIIAVVSFPNKALSAKIAVLSQEEISYRVFYMKKSLDNNAALGKDFLAKADETDKTMTSLAYKKAKVDFINLLLALTIVLAIAGALMENAVILGTGQLLWLFAVLHLIKMLIA